MNEPQVWTLIGVFAASLFAMMGLFSTLFLNVINARFDRVDAKFEQLNSKIDHLDRDVQTLFRRVFPDAS